MVVSIITQAEEITEAGDLGYPCIIRSRRVRTLYTACLCCPPIRACSYHLFLSLSLSLCGQGDVFTNIAKDLVPSPKPKHFVAFFKAKYPSWTEVVFRKDLTLSIDLLKFDKIMVCLLSLRACRFAASPSALQKTNNHKIGIVYQSSKLGKSVWEAEMEDTSPEFKAFLDFLGTKVDLSIWPRYRGDLKPGAAFTEHHWRSLALS